MNDKFENFNMINVKFHKEGLWIVSQNICSLLKMSLLPFILLHGLEVFISEYSI